MKRKDYGAIIFTAALIASLAVHAGLAASWLYSRPGEFGSVDAPTQAVSVNLEATDVLDALESAAAKEAASSPAGAPVTAAASTEQQEREEHRLSKAMPDETVQDKERHPAEESDTEKRRVADESIEKKSAQEEAERNETKQRAEEAAQAEEKEKQEKKQQAAVAGGAGTAGSQEAEASVGRVSAGQGSILNYGASLRAIISAHTPRNIRNRALRVSFNIAPAGGVTRVDVMKSSGDFAVDSTVVDLVRRLSLEFPLPPKGAAPSQLSYNIEIIFR